MYFQVDKQFYRPGSLDDVSTGLSEGYIESINQNTTLATDNDRFIQSAITTKYGNSTIEGIATAHWNRMQNDGVKGNVAIKCDAMGFSIPIGTYSYELVVASDIVGKPSDGTYYAEHTDVIPGDAHFKNRKTLMYGSFTVKKE
jgi:hypothetical protein